MIIKIIFWISALLIMQTYVIYPMLLLILDKTVKRTPELLRNNYIPDISVLMAVHNEEGIIKRKIESLFASEYPGSKMEVLVGSDSSDDSTYTILTELEQTYPELKVLNFTQRIGKAAIINRLSAVAKGDILILTDANVFPEKNTILKLVQNFSDESVGLADTRSESVV